MQSGTRAEDTVQAKKDTKGMARGTILRETSLLQFVVRDLKAKSTFLETALCRRCLRITLLSAIEYTTPEDGVRIDQYESRLMMYLYKFDLHSGMDHYKNDLLCENNNNNIIWFTRFRRLSSENLKRLNEYRGGQ